MIKAAGKGMQARLRSLRASRACDGSTSDLRSLPDSFYCGFLFSCRLFKSYKDGRQHFRFCFVDTGKPHCAPLKFPRHLSSKGNLVGRVGSGRGLIRKTRRRGGGVGVRGFLAKDANFGAIRAATRVPIALLVNFF